MVVATKPRTRTPAQPPASMREKARPGKARLNTIAHVFNGETVLSRDCAAPAMWKYVRELEASSVTMAPGRHRIVLELEIRSKPVIKRV